MLEQAAIEPEPATADKYARRASINSSIHPSPSKQTTTDKEGVSPRNSRSSPRRSISPRGSISPRRAYKDELLRSPYSEHAHAPDESFGAQSHSPHHVHYKGEQAEEKRGSSSSPSRRKQNSNKAKMTRSFDRKSRLMRFAEQSTE